MMNEQAKKELGGYVKATLWSAAVTLSLIVFAMIATYVTGHKGWLSPLCGALFGTFLATVNLFAIGQAFYALAIKKDRRWILLLPVSTFLAMCIVAFILVFYYPSFIVGFALGLTAPVVFGASVIFAMSKPA